MGPVPWDEVVGEVGVDDAAVAVVGDRVLEEGLADAADHAAQGLAVGEFGAEFAARRIAGRLVRQAPRH